MQHHIAKVVNYFGLGKKIAIFCASDMNSASIVRE